jgi:hypothetical protein
MQTHAFSRETCAKNHHRARGAYPLSVVRKESQKSEEEEEEKNREVKR